MSFSAKVMYKKLSFLHAHLFDIILVTTIPSTSSAAALYILVVDGMEVRVKNLSFFYVFVKVLWITVYHYLCKLLPSHDFNPDKT